MGKGDDFKLRQHRVPEERMQRHDQRQPGVALADKDASKAQQRAERAKAHNGQALARVIAQPTPDIRRNAAHQHGNGDQLTDPRSGKPQVIEIQREKGRGGAEQREIEEIETGQTPVRQNRAHAEHKPGSVLRSARGRAAALITAVAAPAC